MENNKTTKNIIIAIVLLVLVILAAYLIIKPKELVAPTSEENTVSNNNSNNMNELKIEVLKEGQGTVVSKSGDSLTVDYKGTLEDGTKFDASADHGGTFTFTVGVGQVIAGWDQGMVNMKIGEKRKLTIPADLAYGNRDLGIIPPNSTLIFEVELIKIN